ncbi:MAG: hypothetical protein PT944_04460 [Actinomycetaceae bacterium]|nr:hypothetical protein [Actinomycetaceae bacterium]
MIHRLGKVCGCLALGVLLAAVGVVVSPGPLTAPWLGFVLAAVVIVLGSLVCSWWCGIAGLGVYVLAVAVLTLWFSGFWPADDVLVLSTAWQYRLWPLTAIVASTVPVWTAQCESARRDG